MSEKSKKALVEALAYPRFELIPMEGAEEQGQMCFDPRAILDWVGGIRQRGIELPVYIGLPGVVERKKLLRISLKIGVGDSARFLKKYTSVLTRFLKPGGYSPDALVKWLAPYVGDRAHNIAGFHIYTFNQVESTEKWRQQALGFERAGSAVSSW